MLKLDIFIQGENLDLCIPTEEFAFKSDWYSWFNNKKITKYLEHGVYPNTKEDQKKFLNSIDNKLVFIISNKNNYFGVISLSEINVKKKTAEIGLALNTQAKYNFLAPLESIALITEHAFEILGLKLIYGGQHVNLEKWTIMMELVGYKVEGIHENRFIKGMEVNNTVSISCNIEDYIFLKKIRKNLWDGNKHFIKRIKKIRKIKTYLSILKTLHDKDRKIYYKKIHTL
jgi:RimJ/RimL family protein N-acetyltransferase